MTSVSTGLDSIDGIPLNIKVWGWNRNTNSSVTPAVLLSALGVSSSSTGLSIGATWTKASGGADGYFTFTDHQDCSGSGCVVNSLSSRPTKTIAQLFSMGVNNIIGWVNGVNVNYQTNISSWDNGSNQEVMTSAASLKLVKQTSEIVPLTDSSIPANMVCVGNCPGVQSGSLVETRPDNWPPTSYTPVSWSSSLGAPTVSAGGLLRQLIGAMQAIKIMAIGTNFIKLAI